jgi:hypothetical protein
VDRLPDGDPDGEDDRGGDEDEQDAGPAVHGM